MIKNFDDQEQIEIRSLLEDILWFNGVEYSFGDNKRKIIVDIDLVNRIISGQIAVEEIPKADYEELIFALTSAQNFLYCAANEEDPILKKFLQALKKDRKCIV